MTCALTATSALAQAALEHRNGFLECGGSHIRARAECYADSDYCTTETLSFGRRAGRTIVRMHPHQSTHAMRNGRKVSALDYTASSWACVPGKDGGRYLLVILNTAGGGNCRLCEYSRLYDLNGRLIAATLAFDPGGRARDHPAGEETMRQALGRNGRYSFVDLYR